MRYILAVLNVDDSNNSINEISHAWRFRSDVDVDSIVVLIEAYNALTYYLDYIDLPKEVKK